jgi:predicted ester cyclase
MSTEENKTLMQHFWKEMIKEGTTEKANEYVADDYVYHVPGGHEIKGIEGFKKYIAWIHDSFPGAQFTVDDLIAEGDKVVSLYTMKGTDKRNKPVEFQGVVISHIVDGKEVEVWDIFDRFTLALQLSPGWAKAMLRSIEKQMVKDQPW